MCVIFDIAKLIYAEVAGSNKAELNGCNLFSDEYSTQDKYNKIQTLFKRNDKPGIVRIPIQGNTIQQFLRAAVMSKNAGLDIIACLDSYENHSSMMNRLMTIKSSAGYVKYIELFNELPHMIDLYPGDKIKNLTELIDKTNNYSIWAKSNIPGVKTITMAPYNSMDERSWSVWDNVTNTEILEKLIKYASTDIAAIHLYGDSFGKKLQLSTLGTNISKWNKSTTKKKKIWVTECGEEFWSGHIGYYNKIVKLMRNLVDIDKVIWYRQCIKTSSEQDNGYALEALDTGKQSELFKLLEQN
jgi:hypothetical protein